MFRIMLMLGTECLLTLTLNRCKCETLLATRKGAHVLHRLLYDCGADPSAIFKQLHHVKKTPRTVSRESATISPSSSSHRRTMQ